MALRLQRLASSGCAVLISRPDSTIYEHYQGVADLCTQEPIDSATRFCIASVSKQFTVAALLQQAALGRVSLADSVARFYPEYTRPFWNTITLADLAGHTSACLTHATAPTAMHASTPPTPPPSCSLPM